MKVWVLITYFDGYKQSGKTLAVFANKPNAADLLPFLRKFCRQPTGLEEESRWLASSEKLDYFSDIFLINELEVIQNG